MIMILIIILLSCLSSSSSGGIGGYMNLGKIKEMLKING